MSNPFEKKYNKILIVSPFWRNGSTLLVSLLSIHNQSENLDEILYDPRSDLPFENWLEDRNNRKLDVESCFGKIHHHISPRRYDNGNKDFDWQYYLSQPDQKWCTKVQADQFHHLGKLMTHQSFAKTFSDSKNSLIMLFRQDVIATIMSSVEAMKTSMSHDNKEYLHPRFQLLQQKKTSHDFHDQPFEVWQRYFEKIYNQLYLPCIESFNTIFAQKWLNPTELDYDHIVAYEDFQQIPYLKEKFNPYAKKDNYFAVYDEFVNCGKYYTKLYYDNSTKKFMLK